MIYKGWEIKKISGKFEVSHDLIMNGFGWKFPTLARAKEFVTIENKRSFVGMFTHQALGKK